MENKKLTKSADRKLAGVCGGLANYLNVDPTVMRVVYSVLTLFSAGFPGVILYILLALLLPNE